MAKIGGLGKGLDSIFGESVIETEEFTQQTPGSVFTVRISDIEPDRDQPRKTFDPESLSSLADSISRHGILQPLVVRKAYDGSDSTGVASFILNGKYRIVSGERRWRAAKMAGLSEVPVVVKDLTDTETAAIMLVENLQREDLNAVEEARGLQRLIEEFELTQEEAAAIVGISRPALTNALRLLTLPKKTLSHLENSDITAGHARALLAIGNNKEIDKACDTVIAKSLSVRETERLVKNIISILAGSDIKEQLSITEVSELAYIEKLQETISEKLGRKTKISKNKKDKKSGKIELEYYDSEDLEKLINLLCGEEIFDEMNV